jgi:PAS domain S-box-containing protein
MNKSRDEPRILLFMQPGRDRELLGETLDSRYHVATTTAVEQLNSDFACCVFDAPEFDRVAGTIQKKRGTDKPVFLPFVLLLGEDTLETTTEDVYDYVDDVIELPVKKATLFARIRNLVERRQTALELADRERKLEETVDNLTLKEQAMDAAPLGITIDDIDDSGETSLVYANEHFSDLTGYGPSILGENCRFLQGEETDPETTAKIREAIDTRQSVSVDILNYRKNGQKFWNKLDISPVRDSEGTVTHFVGFQMDITDRKIRERRLEVMNRLLSHNLRNKMNLIEGHIGLLKNEFTGENVPQSLTEVEEAATSLMELAETVQKVERVTEIAESVDIISVSNRVNQMVSAFEDRFPDVTYNVTLPEDDACEVAVSGLTAAIEEGIENAIKHNDDPNPTVEIRVKQRSDNWVDIEIKDNGPGMPKQEIEVLQEGETPIKHGNRLGIWLMYWVVSKAGGHFSVSDADPKGTVVSLSVPAYHEGSNSGASP